MRVQGLSLDQSRRARTGLLPEAYFFRFRLSGASLCNFIRLLETFDTFFCVFASANSPTIRAVVKTAESGQMPSVTTTDPVSCWAFLQPKGSVSPTRRYAAAESPGSTSDPCLTPHGRPSAHINIRFSRDESSRAAVSAAAKRSRNVRSPVAAIHSFQHRSDAYRLADFVTPT